MLLTFVCVSTLGAAQSIHFPPGTRPTGEAHRYETAKSLEATLEYYRRTYGPNIRWRTIVNQPSIRAHHIKSLRSNTTWEGANIYEHKGNVRIFVLQRETASKPPPKRRKKSKRRARRR